MTAQIQEVKSATILRFAELWQSNFAANQAAMRRHPPVRRLARRFLGLPAIIVGAGPSLDKNIHFLRAAREKAVILAADAALKPLLHQNVVPDLTVSLDPQEDIAKFFTGVRHRGITLVAPTIIHPRVLDLWEGGIVFFNQHAPDIPILKQIEADHQEIGSLTPGGSVLSVTYHLAYEMGCDPILFLGQDLSYGGPRTHSRAGAMEAETLSGAFDKQQENIVYEQDIHGEKVPTLKAMAVSKQWFDWAFTTWKRDRPLSVINCSEAGILTDHVTWMPLCEAIWRHCKQKINVPWQFKKALK
ncbi:MAG: motility associated factor glycosyltransferase family protein [Nitrospinaceae bacterium]